MFTISLDATCFRYLLGASNFIRSFWKLPEKTSSGSYRLLKENVDLVDVAEIIAVGLGERFAQLDEHRANALLLGIFR